MNYSEIFFKSMVEWLIMDNVLNELNGNVVCFIMNGKNFVILFVIR